MSERQPTKGNRNMNLKSVKKQDEIKLAGVVAEVEFKDGSATGVVLRDPAGGVLVVRMGQYSSLDVLVPAPPKMVERWHVHGKLNGFSVSEMFESEYEATNKRRDIGGEGDLTVEKVSVPEEAVG